MAKETLSSAAVNTILQGTNAPVASAVNLDTATTATTHALEIFDKNGKSLGWVPVYAASTLAT